MNASASAPWPEVWNSPARKPLRWLEGFLVFEFLCQLALLLPALNHGPIRIFWRVGVFGLSLLYLAILPGKTRSTAPAVAAIWVIAVLILEIFNPTSNTWMAAVAETTMYIAILAPLFWMTRIEVTPGRVRKILLLFWGFESASSLVGLLQVLYPGRFQPALSPIVASMGQAIAGLKITLPNGIQIFRPMGLSDTPGGASAAGMWTVLFGLGLLLSSGKRRGLQLKRLVYLGTMVIGAACIYLSQARVFVVVMAVWFGALLALLLWQRRWRQFSVLAAMALVVAIGGLITSQRTAGAAITQRLRAVTTASAATRTYSNDRGLFLRQAFLTFLPRYPLGAGLGRWGMMNTYFGDNTDPQRGLIYVEIQWQAWLLDGGIPLTLLYLALMSLAMMGLWRTARRRGPLWFWAAICLAWDVSVLALCFDYTPFTGEMGIEFWFINALILTAAACLERKPQTHAAVASGWPPWL